jgi:voltage-gated potassium channel
VDEMSLKTETIAYVVALIIVIIYGITGTYVLGQRGGFNVPAMSIGDAVYFTVATISTVGYGDIYPITDTARYFVISVIVLGVGVFLGAVVTISGEFVSRRVKAITNRVPLLEKRILNRHVILIGTNTTNQYLAKDLKARNERYIIVTSVKDYADELRDKGFRAFVGDYTSEASMEQFGISNAKAVVIDLRDNSKAVYALLVSLDTAKKARIIVIAPTIEAEKHMRYLSKGRAVIINPADIAARTVSENLFK